MMNRNMLISPTPTPPKMTFSHMPAIGSSPVSGIQAVVHRIDRPLLVAVVETAHSAPAMRRSEAPFLPGSSNLPRAGRPAPRSAETQASRRPRQTAGRTPHHAKDHSRVPHAAGDPAEHPDGRHRYQKNRNVGEDVRPERRVLKRVRRVRPEETAAVGAQLFDGHKGRHRAAGNRLRRPLQRRCHGRPLESHRHAADSRNRPPRQGPAEGESSPWPAARPDRNCPVPCVRPARAGQRLRRPQCPWPH